MEQTFNATLTSTQTTILGNSDAILTSTEIILLPAPPELKLLPALCPVQQAVPPLADVEDSPVQLPSAESPSRVARMRKAIRVIKAAKVLKAAKAKRVVKAERLVKALKTIIAANVELERLIAQPPRPEHPAYEHKPPLLCLPAPEMKYLNYPPSSVRAYRRKGLLCLGMTFEFNGLHFLILEMVGETVKLLAWGDEDHEARWYTYEQVLIWYKKYLQNQEFIKRQKGLTQTGRELIASLLYIYQQNGWVFKMDSIWVKLLDMNIFTNCIQVDLIGTRPDPIRYEIKPSGEALAKDVLPIYIDKVNSLIRSHHLTEKRLREDSRPGNFSKTYVHLGKWGEV